MSTCIRTQQKAKEPPPLLKVIKISEPFCKQMHLPEIAKGALVFIESRFEIVAGLRLTWLHNKVEIIEISLAMANSVST